MNGMRAIDVHSHVLTEETMGLLRKEAPKVAPKLTPIDAEFAIGRRDVWRTGCVPPLPQLVAMGELAQAAAEVRLFQLHNWRTLSRLAKGQAPGPEGSALKLYWSEMSKRMHDTVMAVLGPVAPLWRGAHDNPGDGSWQRSWLYYQASSIWAGTNEIQRNIIGERVLSLPREPKT